MNQKFTKGFTLIELLVVIAIIGILASVVLASLNSARDKGSDAAIKANLANIRTQAELYYDNQSPNSYNTDGSSVCSTTGTVFTDPTVANAIDAAEEASGATATCASPADGSAWAVSLPLKSDSAANWCVDSTGFSGDVGSSTAAGGSCN